jgi:predicted metalloendopeptidase
MNRANNLDTRFEKVQQDFFAEQYGTKSQSARWKKCVDYVNGNMGIAVSALYVKTHFNAESKAKVSAKNKSLLHYLLLYFSYNVRGSICRVLCKAL